ncbi:MAG: mechanosensitive ion channel family protein [Saprospiraceae bacterium]|nr:mechanosensitive ion channel family protein [Saprospiraceae bacterium]
MEELNKYMEEMTSMVIQYAPKLVLAVIVLLVGLRIINKIADWLSRGMKRSGLGDDIRPFLASMLSFMLKMLLIFSVAGIIGIETTSFVAVLAAAGFAVGMALQGSLSNFAAGVLILIFRPYKVGDLIQVESQIGHVREIQMLNTVIITLDNRTVIIPNAMAISGIITNLSAQKHLRIDLKVAISYEENFEKIREIILEVLKTTPKVLEDPAPFVGIETFDSHNLVLAVRPYATVEDYWDVYFEVYRLVKQALGEHNVKIAYPEGVQIGQIAM